MKLVPGFRSVPPIFSKRALALMYYVINTKRPYPTEKDILSLMQEVRVSRLRITHLINNT